MKRFLLIFTIIVFCFSFGYTQDKDYHAKAAKAGSTNAVSLSLVAWGVGITAAIIIACLLIESSKGENSH